MRFLVRHTFVGIGFLMFFVFAAQLVQAQFIPSGQPVPGWLWGGHTDDAIGSGTGAATGFGWVSLSSTNPGAGGGASYSVSIPDVDGDVTGYAWGSTGLSTSNPASHSGVGWVLFNPSGPYPDAPNHAARREGNGLTGWARVMGIATADPASEAGGYEGWIKLAKDSTDGAGVPVYGVTIDPVTGDVSGFGWSSEFGWIAFITDTSVPVPLCGDSICSVGTGETCGTCPSDCGVCPLTAACGGICAGGSCALSGGSKEVTWSAFSSGGDSPYSYSWGGDPPIGGSGPSVIVPYTTTGIKQAWVAVDDSDPTVPAASAVCAVTISPGTTDFEFDLDEIIPSF